MSKSIHITVKQVAKRNSKADLTPDNPDLIALVQKRRFKQASRIRRMPNIAAQADAETSIEDNNGEQGGGGNALEPPSHPSTASTKTRTTP
jgi:hypothetical protein